MKSARLMTSCGGFARGRKSMRRLLSVLFVVATLCLVPTTASAAAVQNVTIPLNLTVFSPCTGDLISVSGSIHLLATATADGAGGFHVSFMDNVSQVTGVGSVTGATYHGVGGDWFTANVRESVLMVHRTPARTSLGSGCSARDGTDFVFQFEVGHRSSTTLSDRRRSTMRGSPAPITPWATRSTPRFSASSTFDGWPASPAWHVSRKPAARAASNAGRCGGAG